jgi:exoribonuclease-2
MIAANGVVARLLEKVSSLRRIVKTPKRWDRIVELAAAQGETLPSQPESKALNDFLLKRKAADPDHFADLSLAVIKLIGPGEYVLERPGDPERALRPGGRITCTDGAQSKFCGRCQQRLIKAFLAGRLGLTRQ